MIGERLPRLVSFEALKLAAAVGILSPYVPLLFMGEEYGEEAPFLYFTSHSDPQLVKAVREGRKGEFKAFSWEGEPPDPQSPETFLKSKIDWTQRREGRHRVLRDFYRDIIRMRKSIPALSNLDKDSLDVWGTEAEKVLFMRRWKDENHSQVAGIFNFHKLDITVTVSLPEGKWQKRLDSSDQVWNGPGTSLPETIVSGEAITLRGCGVAVYVQEGLAQ